MQVSKLLIVVVMLAAMLALAPVANAQHLPSVSVSGGGAITEGDRQVHRGVERAGC